MAGPLYEHGSDVVGVKRCPRDALALACRARGRRYRYVLRTYDPRSPCGATPPLQGRAVTRTSRNGKPSPLPANYGRRGDGLNDGHLFGPSGRAEPEARPECCIARGRETGARSDAPRCISGDAPCARPAQLPHSSDICEISSIMFHEVGQVPAGQPQVRGTGIKNEL